MDIILGKEDIGKGIRISDLEAAENTYGKIKVQGLDGTPLVIEVDKKNIDVLEGDTFMFGATLIRDTLHLVIVNEKDGKKSNNIFPYQLLRYTLDKFGDRVKVIRAAWSTEGGTNTEQYLAARKAAKSSTEAALSTWTGKALSSLNFSKVVKVEESPYWIFAYFER